jgi:hypothetical protein
VLQLVFLELRSCDAVDALFGQFGLHRGSDEIGRDILAKHAFGEVGHNPRNSLDRFAILSWKKLKRRKSDERSNLVIDIGNDKLKIRHRADV